MAEHLRVTLGLPPWSPASDAHLIERIDRYDSPTAVLVNQDSRYFLGQALVGILGPRAVWAFVPLDSASVKRVLAAEGVEEVDALIDEFLVGGVLGVLAIDDGIVFARVVDLGRPASRTDLTARMARGVTEALQDLILETRLAVSPAELGDSGR